MSWKETELMCPGKAIVYILTEDCIETGVAWLAASNGPDHGLTIAAGLGLAWVKTD